MNRNIDNYIPFALPSIDGEEEEAVLSVLRSGWLTTGKEAYAFEQEFSRYVGSSFALAVNSATAGLHLALEALNIQPGDLLITTPYTFTATAEVTRYLDAHPLFVDIENDSFNIDPNEIEKQLEAHKKTGKIKAIIPVHIGGAVCRMDRITQLARAYSCSVVEDAAHAFPSATDSGFAGTLGDAGVFSFYATKPITTGEGGMVVTDNEEIARRASIMRLHGIDREVWDRYQAKGHTSWKYDIVAPGFKYNMADIAAAIGRIQLRKAERLLRERKKIAAAYRTAFSDLDFLTCPGDHEGHAWHLFIICLDPQKLTIDRDRFVEKLMERGIGTSVHYIPLHMMDYYSNRYNLKPEDFPNALRRYSTCFSLPLYPGLTEEQISYIIESVQDIGRSYSK